MANNKQFNPERYVENSTEDLIVGYAERLTKLAEVVIPRTKELTDLVIKQCCQAEIENTGAGERLINNYFTYIQGKPSLRVRTSAVLGPKEYLAKISDEDLKKKVENIIYNPIDVVQLKNILSNKGMTYGTLSDYLGLNDSSLRVCISRSKKLKKLAGNSAGPLAEWLANNDYSPNI